MTLVFGITVSIINVLLFGLALKKARAGQFLGDTFGLWPLGIFVWGDALVLAPFWLVSGIFFGWFSWLGIVRFWLVFVMIRESYEVIYWLNHQAVKSQYRPPFLRNIDWLTTEQVAIIYQLIAMCLVIFAATGLLLSYRLL